MKFWLAISIGLFVLACKKDEGSSFPKSYTFDREDQSDEALYVLTSSSSYDHIPVTTGEFGAARDTLKKWMKEGMRIGFDLKEIELLNEDTLRIRFAIDDEEFDSVWTYSNIDGDIVIDSLEEGLLQYEKDIDQFVVCGILSVAIPGPNTPDPGIEYWVWYLRECQPGYSKDQYVNDMLTSFTYSPLDTIGIIITRRYFE